MSNDPEKIFEGFIKSHGKRGFFHRFTDSAEIHGQNARTKNPFRTIVPAQPADYLVTLEGETFYAEVKSSLSKVSFPFNNIRANQLRVAKQVVTAGGLYLFYILNLNTSRWFVVPAHVVFDTQSDGKQSLRWDEMEQYSCEI